MNIDSSIDILKLEEVIKRSVETVLHRNGLVNGHPLTVSERQGIAIRTAVGQMRQAMTLLLSFAGNSSSQQFKNQCNHHAQRLNDTAEAMEKEFRL